MDYIQYFINMEILIYVRRGGRGRRFWVSVGKIWLKLKHDPLGPHLLVLIKVEVWGFFSLAFMFNGGSSSAMTINPIDTMICM